MSNKNLPILAFATLLFILAQACRTDAPGELPDPYAGPVFSTNLPLSLTNNNVKKWKPVYNTVNGTSIALDSCEKDDRYLFYADGTLKYTWGNNHCFVNEPDTEITSWSLPGGTIINLGSTTYRMYELFEQRFAIQWTEFSGNDTIIHSKHFVPAL